MTGRLDEKRTRFSFDCAFRDISRNSFGRLQSLIVFNDKNEAYFESFTVFLEQPVERTIRIQETEITDVDKEIGRFNRPSKGYSETLPKEKPKSNFR